MKGARALVAAAVVAIAACSLIADLDGLAPPSSFDAGQDADAQDAQASDAPDDAFDSGVMMLVPGIAPVDLSVDGEFVYWTDILNENVGRASKADGGGVVSLASGFQILPTRIALDDTNVYIGGVSGVLRCAKVGCADAPTLATPGRDAGVTQVAVDATNVYWTERSDPTLYSAPKSSNPPTTAVATFTDLPNELVPANGQVYATTAFGGLEVVDVATKTRKTLAYTPAVTLGLALTTGDALYTVFGDAGEVRTFPLDGGAAGTVVAGGRQWPAQLATDSTRAYWIESDPNSVSRNGSIVTCALSACAPRVIADGQRGASAIALDDAYVYWANAGDGVTNNSGAIMRAPK